MAMPIFLAMVFAPHTTAGSTFAFNRNRFVGSYFALTAASEQRDDLMSAARSTLREHWLGELGGLYRRSTISRMEFLTARIGSIVGPGSRTA